MGNVVTRCAVASLPVVAAVLIAAGTDLVADPSAHLGCRILPNAMVPVLAGRIEGCALKPYDRVIAARIGERRFVGSGTELRKRLAEAAAAPSVDLLVLRRGEERLLSVPVIRDTRGQILGRFAAAVVVAAIVMAVSLMILWGSSEPAAAPFAYFYSCISVVLVSVLSGRYSDALVLPGVVASGLIPATLAHLALTFPREREIVRRSPQIVGVLYGFSALLALIAAINLKRSPTVWVLADRTILTLSLAAWAFLVLDCVLALRESQSILERARAKVLLAGTAVAPAVLLGIGHAFGPELPGGSLALATISVAVLPLPIGYAISHYRLFDLGLDLRRAIAHVLYVAASAAVIAGFVVAAASALGTRTPFGDPVVFFSVAFGCFLVGDPLRARLRGAIDSWMASGTERMAKAADAHVRELAELLEPEECARLLCCAVLAGLEPKGVSVFLDEDGDLRLAHACGPQAPVRAAAAGAACETLEGRSLLYLPDEEPLEDPSHAALRGLGVELAVSLRSGDEAVGLLLVNGSRRGSPYTTPQLCFVETVTKQSGVAIHNANLAHSLMVSERLATQGRLGAGLIHDLGKPLGVVEQLAQRMPGRLDDRDRVAGDARTIADLASQMRATLRDFLDATRRAVERGPSAPAEIDDVIDRAVRIVERSHGRDRVSVRLEPGLPPLREGGARLVRALANLLDNALLASDPGDVVEVLATAHGETLGLAVIDRGPGMDESVRARAFEPFFTTRPPDSGSGLGLAVCKDLVQGLGGSIRIESSPGAGTRVDLGIPLARGRRGRA